jgi:anthranilate phosphoribosyltransferase
MENLGMKLGADNEYCFKKVWIEANIAILHAPLFHPAMKKCRSNS